MSERLIVVVGNGHRSRPRPKPIKSQAKRRPPDRIEATARSMRSSIDRGQ